jgi:hypothetical protein
MEDSMIRPGLLTAGLLLILSLNAFGQEENPGDGGKSPTLTATQTPQATPTPTPISSPMPTVAPESPGDFDLVLGVGSLLIKPGLTDYKVNNENSVLGTANLGSASPQLLAGAAFRLAVPNFGKGASRLFGPQPWFAFLSLKFSPDSSQTLNGYVLGMSYKFNKAFAGLAGYALTPVQEPSPGFRAAAIQVVSQNPNVPAYQRFNLNDLQQNNRNAYDGFPLFVQTAAGPSTTRLFSGDPTVVHYHGGFVIGVAIPISLKAALTGPGAQGK